MVFDSLRERVSRRRRRVSTIPDGLWEKCPKCLELIYKRELESNLRVCPKCDHHLPLDAKTRLRITLDEDSFRPLANPVKSDDPLGFPDYTEKLSSSAKRSGLDEALVAGEGKIEGHPVVVGIADFRFMGASMGSALGETFVRIIQRASETQRPAIVFSASGGARMQEGLISLMQMAKTSAALAALHARPTLYISVITDPTFAGVLASFASLGDIVIAEPGARVGFAGERLIEQNLKVKLPPHVHTAEFQYEHGMIDMILPRSHIRPTLARVLKVWSGWKRAQVPAAPEGETIYA